MVSPATNNFYNFLYFSTPLNPIVFASYFNPSQDNFIKLSICTAIISGTASIFGLATSASSKREVRLAIPGIDWAKKLMQLYFLMAAPLSLGLISFAIYGFGRIQKLDALIYAESEKVAEWNKKYGNLTPQEVSEKEFIITLLISTCQMLGGILFFNTSYNAFRFGELAAPSKMLLKTEMLVVCQALLSCIILCSLTTTKAGLTHLPENTPVPSFLFGFSIFLAFLLLVLSIVGFAVLYREAKASINIIAFLGTIIAGFLLVIIILLFLYIPYSNKELMNGCSEMLPLLNEDYIMKAGCLHGKYKQFNESISNLECQKEDMKLVWEQNYLTPNKTQYLIYGCINSSCCKIVIADIKQVFAFSVFTSILATICAIFVSWAMIRTNERIKETGRIFYSFSDLFKKGHAIIFAIMVIGIIMTIVYNQKKVYRSPSAPTFLKISAIQKNAAELGKFKFPDTNYKNGKFELNVKIHENRTACYPFCEDFVYTAMITTDYPGKLSVDTVNLPKYIIIDSEEENRIEFRCYFNNLNEMLQKVAFETPYPAKTSTVWLEIRTQQDPDFKDEWEKEIKGGLRRLLSDLFEKEDPSYTVLKRNINFQMFPTPDHTKLTGNVATIDENSHKQGIPLVKIKAKLIDEGLQEIYETESDENGNYQLEIPIYVTIKNFSARVIPYQILLEFFKPDYFTAYTSLTVGAMGLNPEINMQDIYMEPIKFEEMNLALSGKVKNIVDEITPYRLSISILNPVNKTFKSNYDGSFTINSNTISCKTAKLQISEEGFYDYNSKEIACSSCKNILPLIPIINEYKLRTVLTWEKSINDLDLHVIFNTGNKIQCVSDFTQSKCGAAYYHGDHKLSINSLASETIDLEQIGNFRYIFYVDAYHQTPNETLSNTNAKIQVFSGFSSYSVAEIFVPTHEIFIVFYIYFKHQNNYAKRKI